jgi:flagellar protein FliO/FliZ
MIDLWESLFRTLSALAIVLLLVGLAALVARRVMGSHLGPIGTRPLIQVLASGYLAPRKTIALVSVAGEYLIVGMTATDMVPLGRVSDSAKVQELLASPATDVPAAAPIQPQSFLASWFSHHLSNGWLNHKGNHGAQ